MRARTSGVGKSSSLQMRRHVEDPDLGYTQGMCFAAAVVALGDGDLADKQQRFSQLMQKLRSSAARRQNVLRWPWRKSHRRPSLLR